MPTECHKYKVTGTVKFSLDGLLGDNPEDVLHTEKLNLQSEIEHALYTDQYELVGDLHIEESGPCDEDDLRWWNEMEAGA